MCSTLAIFLRAPSILDSVLSMSCPRSSSMTDCSSSSLPICLLMTLRLPTDFWMPSSSSSWLTISSCCCLWVVSSRRRMGLSTSFLRLVYLAVREGLNSSSYVAGLLSIVMIDYMCAPQKIDAQALPTSVTRVNMVFANPEAFLMPETAYWKASFSYSLTCFQAPSLSYT
uniref:Putative secreted protein n=1 Tax=Ixodes ricinus TaxID=34613 RepID=A0A6B0UXT3_IXORI